MTTDVKKRVIAAAFYAAAAICAVMALYGWQKEHNAGSSYEDLRESVTVTAEPEQDTEAAALQREEAALLAQQAEHPVLTADMPTAVLTEMTGETAEAETAASEIPDTEVNPEPAAETDPDEVYIDFAELQKLCPDAYAWIRVPGTNVDYPIVQSPADNTFYLDHNPQGEYEYAGAIFTEDYNSKDFEDPHTVIYGHNMKNGSMFQTLHRFEDKAFFDEHREFEICLPDKVLHYQIFAAYTYDDRHLLKTYDFEDEDVFRLYLQEILGQKSMGVNLAGDAEVTPEDRIVTLSTCNGVDDQRYLVQGVLLSE